MKRVAIVRPKLKIGGSFDIIERGFRKGMEKQFTKGKDFRSCTSFIEQAP